MFERLMFKKVEFWLVGLLTITGCIAVVWLTAVARVTAVGDDRYGDIGDAVLTLSMLPDHLDRTFALLFEGEKVELSVAEERFEGQEGFAFGYTPGSMPDAGYLLLSRYDGSQARSIVELVDLDAQAAIHAWTPDFSEHNARSTLESRLTDVARDNAPTRARIFHPILTPAGELVFQNMSPLVKIDACSGLMWMVDRLFHHANEPLPGGGYLVAGFLEPQTIPRVSRQFKEDAILRVADDGRVLYEKSVPQLLIDNGLSHLVYGLDFYSDDPLHLNDVEFVPFDGPHWRAGDLFLSLRNVSAVVLYRPSTNQVVWLRQGPWVNQHDIDVIDAHRIAVFNNNRFNGWRGPYVDGSNEVIVYDFSTDTVSSPYVAALRELDVRTISEGLFAILPEGDLVVEESNYGRILRVTLAGDVVWSYVNRAPDGRVYLLNWSRYIPASAGRPVASHLASVACRSGAPHESGTNG